MKKLLFLFIYIVAFAIVSSMIYKVHKKAINHTVGGRDIALANYGKSVDSLAKIFDLSPEYLMALIMLESSGRKKVPVRFEKRIYKQLLMTQKGKLATFEQISTDKLKNYSNKELKKLACSYGPFQIMGYKSIELNIPLAKLTGKHHLYWAIKWINTNYGDFIRNKEFKDAFHIHNAGKKYPENGKAETFDPKYVERGLEYMKYFKNHPR